MTSNATLLSKDELSFAGFVEHKLLRPLGENEKTRWLYVTQELETLLRGQSGDNQFPSTDADVVVGRFCKGHIVSVTAKPSGKADFKRLSGLDEAWTMTFPGPGSGWRLFGRFARKNIFVGLICLPRDACAPRAIYDAKAAEMIAGWESKWAAPPLRRASLIEYLGENHFDKDAE